MIRPFLRLCCILLLLAIPATAQEPQGPDYDAWGKAAAAAEKTVGDSDVTDDQLVQLRAEMVKWRTSFTDAQGANGDAIETLKGQIAALGDPPAEGASEDPAIAQRRAELNDALAKLQAPVIAATEAASRADGVVRSIDKLQRERQADKLLRTSPTALNPLNWSDAGQMLYWMSRWIYDETHWRLSQPANFNNLRNNLPLIAALVAVSAVLMLRGSRWMMALARAAMGKFALRGSDLVTGFVSLGQVLLPVAGALLLTQALKLTTLFGPIMTQLFEMLPGVVFLSFAMWWLGNRIFPLSEADRSALGFTPDGGAEGRFHVTMLSIALILHSMLINWITPRAEDYLGGAGRIAADKAQEIAAHAEAALSVTQTLLILFGGVALFRLGQLIRRQLRKLQSETDDALFRHNLMRWVANAVIVMGVLGSILALVGYVAAANALVWPTVLTLALIALMAVLQNYFAEFYFVLTRNDDHRSEALVPVLIGFALTLCAVPLAALIWGMRPEQLADMWLQFLTGFQVGGVKISPGIFLTFVVIFAIGYTITRLLQGALRSTILPKTTLDLGGQNAIVAGAGYVGIFLAALLAISIAGINLSSLAIVAGALSVGVGFGLQTIVQNFVSGIILLVERPISEGDWIEVGGQQGIVKAISVRATRIETFDRSEVVIPNASLIAGSVTNMTRTNKNGRVIIKVGVAYGTDTRRVVELLKEIGEGHPLVMMAPGPVVLFTDMGADSLNFELRVILADVNFGGSVRTELNHQILERFAKEGIEIPFAQRDVWLRNPETLATALRAPQPEAAPAEADVQPEPAAAPAPVMMSDNDGEEEEDKERR
jgi:small-conductance mechanosensitive channel